MTPEESQHLARVEQARQRWNVGDLNGYLTLYDPAIVLHGYDGVGPGFANVKAFYEAFWAGFTENSLVFEDILAAGDRLAIRFTLRAVHSGPFQGIPPSGARVTLPGITILRFRDGRCVERWSQADFMGLLIQIGALPAPGGVQ